MTEADKSELERAGYKVRKLFLCSYAHNRKMPLKTFIERFLLVYNSMYPTCYVAGYGSVVKQCSIDRSRSLGDIFMLCDYYYDDITINEVKSTLLSFGTSLVGHFCSGINRRIYELSPKMYAWEQCNKGEYDEFGDVIEYTEYIRRYEE